MIPAPFSPATLRRIREGASAADLGWDQQRYNRVCDAHGLPRAPSFDATAAILPAHATECGQVKYNPATGIITRGYNDVLLTVVREKAIFEYLFDLACRGDDSVVSREKLIEATGEGSNTFISAVLIRLDQKLAPLKCRIEVHKSRFGGARLVVRP